MKARRQAALWSMRSLRWLHHMKEKASRVTQLPINPTWKKDEGVWLRDLGEGRKGAVTSKKCAV